MKHRSTFTLRARLGAPTALALAALALLIALSLAGCAELSGALDAAQDIAEALQTYEPADLSPEVAATPESTPSETPSSDTAGIDEYGAYTSKEDVALYIFTYGRLPDNFVTKADARAKGWEGGSLEEYFPGCCIGGDSFGNREGLLPKADGRTYTECDIDTLGASSRGAKRIVFSNDGLIFYTDDHYESFTLLYGEE